jgi:hypothetical protein
VVADADAEPSGAPEEGVEVPEAFGASSAPPALAEAPKDLKEDPFLRKTVPSTPGADAAPVAGNEPVVAGAAAAAALAVGPEDVRLARLNMLKNEAVDDDAPFSGDEGAGPMFVERGGDEGGWCGSTESGVDRCRGCCWFCCCAAAVASAADSSGPTQAQKKARVASPLGVVQGGRRSGTITGVS